MPLVSVVTPFYNERKHLLQMLDSLLAQTFSDFEAILVDDGSTDGGREIVESFADVRFRLLCNNRNMKNLASRNKGMAACKGKYIAVLDADDIAIPQRLEKQVAFMESRPHIDVCGGYILDFYADGREILSTREAEPESVAVQALFQIPVAHTTCMMKRDVFEKDGFKYDESNDKYDCKDYDLFNRLIIAGKKLANLPEVLVKKRIHGASITFSSMSKSFEGNANARRHLFDKLGIHDLRRLEIHHRLCNWLEWPNETSPPDDFVKSWFDEINAANRRVHLFDAPTLDNFMQKNLAIIQERKIHGG